MLDASGADALRNDYERDGFVGPVKILNREDALETIYQNYMAQSQAALGREVMIKPHLVSPEIDAVAGSDAALDAIEAVLGPDILLWSSSWFVKTAGGGKIVGWHQDSHDWGLEPIEGIATLWVAATPSLTKSGAVQFIPGSHKLGPVTHEHTFDPNNLLSLGQQIEGLDEGAAVDMELQPGEASIHNSLVIHGGGPNTANWDRIGLILNYISADVRQTRASDSVTWMRGRKPDHFIYENRPMAAFSPEAVEELEAALKRPSGFNEMAGK